MHICYSCVAALRQGGGGGGGGGEQGGGDLGTGAGVAVQMGLVPPPPPSWCSLQPVPWDMWPSRETDGAVVGDKEGET